MDLTPPDKVRKLQEALHAKAKGAPDYRFYALYDKVYREDILAWAYARCRENRGAAGTDGQSFEAIEKYGRERWLGELAKELREKRYQASAVRRVWIPKANGKLRPLGLPTIRDRVVQMAAAVVIGPIFEADMPDEQYAYREDRSALDAVRHVHQLLRTGYDEVVDADLSGYFDSIPHAELMKSLARRISDGRLLALIKMWLEAPVEERDERDNPQRTTRNRDTGRGTPQGAPISPLLANIYMRRFILGWKQRGYEQGLRAKIVNYADDFVICCRSRAEEAGAAMRRMMRQLKLVVNEEKTRICRVPQESIDFLGYTLGRCYRAHGRGAYIGTRPSRKRVQRICRELTELAGRRWTWLSAEAQVERFNRKLRGWSNYFCLGQVSPAYVAVEEHARHGLRQWLCRKHKVGAAGYSRFPNAYLHERLGLIRLRRLTRTFPWAKA